MSFYENLNFTRSLKQDRLSERIIISGVNESANELSKLIVRGPQPRCVFIMIEIISSSSDNPRICGVSMMRIYVNARMPSLLNSPERTR